MLTISRIAEGLLVRVRAQEGRRGLNRIDILAGLGEGFDHVAEFTALHAGQSGYCRNRSCSAENLQDRHAVNGHFD
jgi:hypothetical protein